MVLVAYEEEESGAWLESALEFKNMLYLCLNYVLIAQAKSLERKFP